MHEHLVLLVERRLAPRERHVGLEERHLPKMDQGPGLVSTSTGSPPSCSVTWTTSRVVPARGETIAAGRCAELGVPAPWGAALLA